MAKPYTKITNELLDNLAKLHVSGSTMNVLIAIIRNTISYHRNQHEISNGFLEKATGLKKSSVTRAIKELERREIIKIVQESRGSHPRVIRILVSNIGTVSKTDPHVLISDTNNVLISDTINVSNFDTQEIKETKEIKEKKRKLSPLASQMMTLDELKKWNAEQLAENDEEEEGYEYL